MMPLTMGPRGELLNIKKIIGKDEAKRHLADLGLIEGESITVVAEMAGNLIINLRGARIAIDKALATRIMI